MSKDTVNNYKISIIVCCYNKDKTLQKTINNLLNQTMFKELELIFVNDCSTDNTGKILNSLVEKHNKNNNIKLINLDTNKGVFVARKIGIQNATAEYVGFCDADDYVDKGYYEELYNSLFDNSTNGNNIVDKNNSDIDIIQTSSVKFFDENNNIKTNSDKFNGSYKEGICDLSNYENLLDVLFNWGTVWNRLFKRNIISNVLKIQNEKINYMEDHIITIISLLHSHKYKAIETKNYYYYNTSDNINHLIRKDNEESDKGINKMFNIIDQYIKNNNLLKFENVISRYEYYYLLGRNIAYLKNIQQTDYFMMNKDKLMIDDITEEILSTFKTKEEQDYFINFNMNLKKIVNLISILTQLYQKIAPANDKRLKLINESFK